MKQEIKKSFLIILFCSLVQSYEYSIPLSNVLSELLKEFHIKNPNIFHNNNNTPRNDIHHKANLVKVFSNLGHTCTYNYDHNKQTNIIFTNLNDFKPQLSSETAPILILTQIEEEKDLIKVNLSIDKQIYFVDEVSWKIYETYTINELQIIKYLGVIQATNSALKEGNVEFVKSEQYIPFFEKRRSNFHGVQLNAMVELESPYVYTSVDNFASEVSYFSNNKTYDMTNVIDGVYVDVLHSLEKIHNFSTKLYMRKDREWGVPKSFPNGTVILDGMIKTLVEIDSVDFIWTALDILPARISYVQFLTPLSYDHGGIFIPNQEKMNQVHFILYLEPFSLNLWIAILLTDLLIVGLIYITHWFSNSNSMVMYGN